MNTDTIKAAEPLSYGHADTPIGTVLLVGGQGGLSGLYLAEHARTPATAGGWVHDEPHFDNVRHQLGEYFAGTRTEFDLPLRPVGTPFQLAVWDALRGVSYGETASYGQIARRIERATAVRAVGAANGLNPLSIVIPCHRIIGASGALTGYGWGLERKRWLLDHEQHRLWPAG